MDIKLKYRSWVGQKYPDLTHKLFDSDVETFAVEFVEHLMKGSSTVEEIKNLINQYKKEKLPDADVPFHYESEIASGFKYFIKWLETKNSL